MPLNPLDDAVDELDPQQEIPAQAPAQSAQAPAGGPAPAAGGTLYDRAMATLQARTDADETAIRRSVKGGASPDAAVEASRLARRYKAPTPIVARNLESYQQRAKADDLNDAGKANPRLGSWMAKDPANAAIAAPDIPALSALERATNIGRNVAGFAQAGFHDIGKGLWGVIEAAAEFDYLGHGKEVTPLNQQHEAAFQAWALENKITDVDKPGSFYDYRGYWLQIASKGEDTRKDYPDGLHFPDTFKQHGHPTFSQESQWSMGAGDGGHWGGADGETFIPQDTGARGAIAEFARGAAQVADYLATKARGDTSKMGWKEQAAYSGVESIVSMLPGMALGFATGGSSALLTLAGATTGGQSYHDARAQGVEAPNALAFAGFQGGVEVATEFLPAHLVLGDLAKRAGLVKILAHQIASEIPGEEVATALQDLGEWAVLPANDEKTFSDYLRERPGAAAETAISVIVSIGATSIATHATVRVVEKLGEAAKESQTLKTAPAVVEQLLAHAAEEAGATTFYTPLDVWNTYWQEQGADPITAAAEVTGNPDAHTLAQTTGLLEIPGARYAVMLAGTEHNNFFKNELTLDPNVPNARQAGEDEAAKAAEPEAEPTRRQQVGAAVAAQLEAAGFRPRDAETNAAVADAAFGTMAEAAGEDPLTVFQQYGIVIERPDLAQPAAPEGDTIDQKPEAVASPANAEKPAAPDTAAEILPPAPAPSTPPAAETTPPVAEIEPENLIQAPAADVPRETGSSTIPEAPGAAAAEPLPDVAQEPAPEAGAPATPAGEAVPAVAAETPVTPLATTPARPQTREERIAELEGQLRAAERAADVDKLTGLANRAALDKALPAAEADPKVHVVVFDANNFGKVNKAVGHEAGDSILIAIGAAIKEAAGAFGVGERVFRRGGDEFVVLAPAAVAEQVRARAELLFGEQQAGDVTVSLSGSVGKTFAQADSTLQAAKQATKDAQAKAAEPKPIPPEQVYRDELSSALKNLAETGVSYGPGGLKVRIVPRATEGRYELEVTERGQRRFEGDFPLEQGPAIGAQRLAELAVTPTPRVVTPQVGPPAGGTGHALAPFASNPAQRTAKTPTGTEQEVYRSFRRALDKALKTKDDRAIVAEAARFKAYYDLPEHVAPDSWQRWEREGEDATQRLAASAKVDIGQPLVPSKAKQEERAAIAAQEASGQLVQDPDTGGYVLTYPAPVAELEAPDPPAILPQPEPAPPPEPGAPASYALEAGGATNSLRFATAAEADAYGAELASRWGGATNPHAVPSEDAITHRFDADTDKAIRIETAPAETVQEPAPAAPEAVAIAPEEAQTQASVETPIERDLDGGATVRPGDTGEPADRPGDVRAQAVAGVQPDAEPAVSAKPGAPKRSGKRGPRKGRPDVGGGAQAPSVGDAATRGGGTHAPEHVDTADMADDPAVAAAHARGEAPRRFVIDDSKQLTEGGWTVKLENNLAAIRLLKALEREGRMATDAEQAILARYIGWGHTELKDVVEFFGEGKLSTRDPRKEKARAELEELLTKAEIQELGESTPNAHYSFADLPRAMWAAVQQLGFKSGSILEPAVGTGHFLGTMPGEIRAAKKTRLWAVEKEPIAAGIARQLYQDVNVQNSPFQEANLPDSYYDLIISNVPFGKIRIFDPAFVTPARDPISRSVHNYYFGKALDLVRPGGVIAFVTSRYTMDSRSDTVRKFLAERADLLGAVRLPDQAFKATAGTDVVTDIIFLRKRLEGEAPKRGSLAWVDSVPNEALSEKDYTGKVTRAIHTNAYYQAHPEHVLGTQDMSGKMAQTNEAQYNVTGSLTLEQLVAGMQRALPRNVYKPSGVAPRKLAAVISKDIKQGSFQVEDGKLFLYDKGTLAPSDLAGDNLERAINFVAVRDTYQTVLDAIVQGKDDATLAAAQRALLGKYKFFVATHGYVNEPKNRKVIEIDPNGGRVLALEHIELVKTKGRPAVVKILGFADIMPTKEADTPRRTYTPPKEPTAAADAHVALTQSLAWHGSVDVPYMAALTGKTELEVTQALEGHIYRDPVTQTYVPKAEYLSGDVTTKLAQAEAAALEDPAFEQNVAELTKVLPTQFTPEDFPAPFGATWVPVETYQRFIAAETQTNAEIKLVNGESRVKFYVDAPAGSHQFLPAGSDLATWVARALNGELPIIYSGTGDSRVQDPAATKAYRESLAQLRERWAEWWPADPEAADSLTKIYNGMFNRDTPYVADGQHVVLAGANPEIKMRPWQNNAIWRALQTGNTLLAHAVGAGKTYAMIAIAGEWKRLGLANKPLIVVPNHLTAQWAQSFATLYPAARVLTPTKEDFTPGNRQKLIARIANNDWDAVIMAQSQFLRVSVKEATLRAFIKEQEDQLLADGAEQMNMSTEEFQALVSDYGAGDKDAVQALSARNAPRSVKDIARGILSLRARLQKRLNQATKDAPVTFEELGIDGLLVDEAHLYKNLFFSTAKNGISGLAPSDAGRAMDMFLKVRHINKASNNRNVVFATGTPVSNAIAELYTMFRYLAQPTLDRLGMSGFDAWANGNAEARAEMEKAAGTGYKERTRLRKWTNLRELSALFRRFADVVSTADLVASGEITLPKMLNGTPTVVALDGHPDMPAFMAELDDRIEALKTGTVDPKDDNHLLISTQAALAAIDIRLVKPNAAADPNGRIPTAALEIAKRYKQSKKTKGVQIVFLDVGVPDAKHMPPLPKSVTNTQVALAEPAPDAVEDDDEGDLVDPEAEHDKAMAAIMSAGFSRDLYGDLRRRLVAEGIKDDEIAYIHQAKTPYELEQLFAAVNDGRIRVFIASTAKGGTGMNVQTKLTTIHHLDVPWRPADIEQRNGRIFRQKNENAEAEEVRYVTKKSFDEYRWGVLVTKQSAIQSLLKGELTSMDDIDPAQLDMQLAQASASGDPRTLQMLNKDREVQALRVRYLAYTSRINSAKRALVAGTTAVRNLTTRKAAIAKAIVDAKAWEANPILELQSRASSYSVGQLRPFDMKDAESRKAFNTHIENLLTAEPYEESINIGTGGPYVLTINKTTTSEFTNELDKQGVNRVVRETSKAYYLTVKTQLEGGVKTSLGSTSTWTVDREFPNWARSIDSFLAPKALTRLEDQAEIAIQSWTKDMARDTEIAAKEFGQIDQLRTLEAELRELRIALGIDHAPAPAADDAPAPDAPRTFGQPIEEQPAVPQPAGGQRGNITFGKDATGKAQTTIRLFAHSNLSTFLHESGHLFLEVFGDLAERVRARDQTTLTPEQTRLVDDYDALLTELGVTNRREIDTPQHEQFATAFESYLEQGQAPSEALRGPFARFRAWLLAIYHNARGRTPVSPALKGIFDRMLASEAEIDAAEHDTPALFTTPEEAGMSPARFAQYQAAVQRAHDTTRERIDREIAREVRREQTEQWRLAEEQVRADVTDGVMQQPVYRALQAITEGVPTTDDTPPVPLTLDHTALVGIVGVARAAALPANTQTLEHGNDPELVATVLGFSSADELVTAITAAPPAARVIAEETAKRMAAEHGSMLTDGTLHETAQAARANEDHDAIIRSEIAALWQKHEQTQRAYERRWLEAEAKLRIAIAEGRKQVAIDALTVDVSELKAKARSGAATIRRAQPNPKALRMQAQARIASTEIRNLKPQVYWAAARRGANEAIALAARQDLLGAITAKTAQLTNLAYFTEATKAKAEVDKTRKWVAEHDKTPHRAALGKASHTYLDQWDGILDRFDFKRVSAKVLARRANLASFIAAIHGQGLPLELPAILVDEAKRQNYLTLTVDAFMGVTDGLRQIAHLATLKNNLLRASAKRTFEAERDALELSIRETPSRKVPLEFRPSDQKWRALADGIAAHATLSTVGYAIDGHKYGGAFWEAIVRPANEAASDEEDRNQKAGTAYHAILEQFYPGRQILELGDKVFVKAIGGSMSKEGRLALAMNWGNQTSRDRVLADPFLNWKEPQVQAVLDTLDKRDWDFVQAHWDYLNTYWPEIAEKSKRLTGLEPEKVDAVQVDTKFGPYPGGYHPLVYDSRKSPQVGKQEAVSEARLAVAGAYLAATTRRGHTITRLMDVHLPLRLDMSATTQHLAQVIHDLTHHEMLIDTTRLLRDPKIAAAIHDTQGDIVANKLGRLFSDIATGDRTTGRPTLAEKGATWLRSRAQIAGLGWNLWTALQQPLGMFNGMERVGVKWVAKGATRWLRDAAHMENTVAMVSSKSQLMRTRASTGTQDLHDLRQTLGQDGGWFDRLLRTTSGDHVTRQTLFDSYLWFIGVGQRVADMPTWLGAYEKELSRDPLDEKRAIAMADQAVLDSQGGGQIKDLAEVQRGGQVAKLFMTFASYGVTTLNASARAAGATDFKSPASVLTFLGHLGLIYTIPTLLTEALRCGVGRAHCDEIPEFLERVGAQSLSTALNGILYVREAAASVNVLLGQETGPRGYEGTAGSRVFQIVDKLAQEIHQGKPDVGLEKAAMAASGILFRYPAAQVQRTIDGFVALEEGRTHNPAAIIFGPPSKSASRGK